MSESLAILGFGIFIKNYNNTSLSPATSFAVTVFKCKMSAINLIGRYQKQTGVLEVMQVSKLINSLRKLYSRGRIEVFVLTLCAKILQLIDARNDVANPHGLA